MDVVIANEEDCHDVLGIQAANTDVLAGQLSGLVEWLEVTGPPAVRDHLASIGDALIDQYR